MLATSAAPPPTFDGWLIEPKWDGVRAVVTVHDGHVTIASRLGNDVTGGYPDCFFDPDVAQCLRDHDRSAATAPIVGRCQPERCRNSRIGDHHLGEWEDRLAQLRRDLRTRGLPPIQKRHLVDQRDRLAAAVTKVRAGRKDGT